MIDDKQPDNKIMAGLRFHYSVGNFDENYQTVRQHVSFLGLHHLKNFSFWHLFHNNFIKYYKDMDLGLFDYKNFDQRLINKFTSLR